jgi:putative oxidoreductase
VITITEKYRSTGVALVMPVIKRALILETISTLLVVLYIYTAVSKLIELPEFRAQMHNQEIPKWLADILVITLPPVEILTALALVFNRTRFAGFWLSVFLMTLFTGYVGLIIAGFYSRMPCSCGGVLKSMGWNTHLAFNLFSCCQLVMR